MTKVLVVDDDEAVRNIIQDILEDIDISCTLCDSPLSAVESVRNEQFDVIIADFSLPPPGLGHLFSELKSRQAAAPPLILTSGHSLLKEDLDHSLVRFFLRKPFRSQELQSLVQACVINQGYDSSITRLA